MSRQIADIAVAAPLGKTLSYLVPAELAGQAAPGVRVRVPLGRRMATGYLLSVKEGDGAELKEIADCLDTTPLFDSEWARFVSKAAAYYHYPPGEAFRTALPAGLSGGDHDIRVVHDKVFTPTGQADLPRGARQREILAAVSGRGEMTLTELRDQFQAPHQVLNRLVETGFLACRSVEKRRDPFASIDIPPDHTVTLSAEQQSALDTLSSHLDSGQFHSALLHGVTGSGKTEVYLQLIADVIRRGRQALVMVPEIALTPQLVSRFRSRFETGAAIAVLHSGLSDGERYDAWRAIMRGEVDIVIGARSAVFAPMSRLAVIIVDEEHEASYKQSEGFRYHARDLALLRGQMSNSLVLLGSATPSLGTGFRARQQEMDYLRLTGRMTGQDLPGVELVDMREEPGEGPLSEPLLSAVAETVAAGEQVLLLLNRRGFAPYLICAECGYSPRCPNCAITLTYHQGRRNLVCHYCDYTERPADTCPECGGADLSPEGAGTERLETELQECFPQARILRMDRDTTSRKGTHQKMVDAVLAGEVDILLGTQMVAKGHDFPNVTLVGVVDADNALNFPDFRSAERTFALLAQVAGRAGRGAKPGRVYVQTYSPEHYALQCAANHDAEQFFATEMQFREPLGYPPFGHLVNLVLAGNDADKVQCASQALANALEPYAGEAELLGPAPCPMFRLRGKTRYQVLLKAARRMPLHRLLQHLEARRSVIPGGVRLQIDVDPLDMF